MPTPRADAALGENSDVAIYSVCDARFFAGLVALINSLRIHGHREPVYIVDCGLTSVQREALAGEATVLPSPENLAPQLLKYAGPLCAPASVMVLVDADIIVTRSLDPLIAEARAGRVVAFTDTLEDRYHDDWSKLLGIGPVRRQQYVNSGFLALPAARGIPLLERLEELQQHVELNDTILAGGPPESPFYFPDQDVLNALLASEFAEHELCALPGKYAPHPPFAGVSIVDHEAARCSYDDGDEPYALHHVLQQKPWLAPTAPTPYSELLPRLWFADDVAVRLETSDVPLRFRSGSLASVARRQAMVTARINAARGRLGLRSYFRVRRSAHGRGEANQA